MKILVDSSLPLTLAAMPNPEGVVIDRVADVMDDIGLVTYAAEHGYAALIVSEPEIVAQNRVRALAKDHSLALVYSVTEDPVEAETNIRHALPSLVERAAAAEGALFYRVGKSGIHPGDTPRQV